MIVLALLALLGCGTDPSGIRVSVTSADLRVPEDVDTLRFEAMTTDGARMASGEFMIAEAFPHSLVIRPASEASRATVHVLVTGLRGRVVVDSDEGDATFRPGTIVDLFLNLSGGAVPRDAGPRDAGEGDAGEGDAGGEDAGTMDAGRLDAGRMDAGMRDAGMRDAGMRDAGMLDAGPRVDAGCTHPLPCPGFVLISEVSTGRSGAGTDEYVELHNPTGSEVNLGGVRVQYMSAAGPAWSSTRATIAAGTTIAPGGYYLLATTAYLGMPAADAMLGGTSFAGGTGGHVRIVTAGDVELDRLGWGTAAFPEGTAIAVNSAEIYERKAVATSTEATMALGGTDELRGNGHDTGDNAADFVRPMTRGPQNAASPREPP